MYREGKSPTGCVAGLSFTQLIDADGFGDSLAIESGNSERLIVITSHG